jgi:hypothetical protein
MIATLYQAARLTLNDPRAGARWVLAQGLPNATLVQILLLTGVLGGLISAMAGLVLGPPQPGAGEESALLTLVLERPLLMAVFQTIVQFAVAWSAFAVGRLFGGKGTLAQALALVAWVEVLLLAVQALQLVLMVALPPLSVLLSPVALILFFWLMTAFVGELHGFTSSFGIFVGIILTGLAMAVLAALALAVIFGPGGLGNV